MKNVPFHLAIEHPLAPGMLLFPGASIEERGCDELEQSPFIRNVWKYSSAQIGS